MIKYRGSLISEWSVSVTLYCLHCLNFIEKFHTVFETLNKGTFHSEYEGLNGYKYQGNHILFIIINLLF